MLALIVFNSIFVGINIGVIICSLIAGLSPIVSIIALAACSFGLYGSIKNFLDNQ